MFKLIKIKTSGFRQLNSNFELDFLNETKVTEEDLFREIIEIERGLYSFRTLAFVGSNASGKTTILTLIIKCLSLLHSGRWEYFPLDYKEDKIKLSIIYYLDNIIYEYYVELGKIDNFDQVQGRLYSPIMNQKLYSYKYDKTRGKKNFLTFDENKEDISNKLLIVGDTSNISSFTNKEVQFDYFANNNLLNIDSFVIRNSFFDILKNTKQEILFPIINLLDESIEYIKPYTNDTLYFKRYNEKEIIMQNNELISILSSGTIRGIELFVRSYNALKYGKIFVVDEIEDCFQKNVVNNIIDIFNDKCINQKGAQVIFSTHYTEILDSLNRRDCIFITNKKDNLIHCEKLYKKYNIRSEKVKSRLFDNNIFNTSLNYDKLMEVRRNIKNELCISND